MRSGTASGKIAAPKNGMTAAPSSLIGNRIAILHVSGTAAKQSNTTVVAITLLFGIHIAIIHVKQSGTGRIIAKRSGAVAVGVGRDVGQHILSAAGKAAR